MCSPIRSIAATSAFASTGSSRAGRSKESPYGSGSTSIVPSSVISAYSTYVPAPKLTTLSTEMSSRSSDSEALRSRHTSASFEPAAGAAGVDQDAGEGHEAGEALGTDGRIGAVAVVAPAPLGRRRRRARRRAGNGLGEELRIAACAAR